MLLDHVCRQSQSKTRLACAAGAGERDHARSPQQPAQLGQLPLASDE
jgi:hypothetical protein